MKNVMRYKFYNIKKKNEPKTQYDRQKTSAELDY